MDRNWNLRRTFMTFLSCNDVRDWYFTTVHGHRIGLYDHVQQLCDGLALSYDHMHYYRETSETNASYDSR